MWWPATSGVAQHQAASDQRFTRRMVRISASRREKATRGCVGRLCEASRLSGAGAEPRNPRNGGSGTAAAPTGTARAEGCGRSGGGLTLLRDIAPAAPARRRWCRADPVHLAPDNICRSVSSPMLPGDALRGGASKAGAAVPACRGGPAAASRAPERVDKRRGARERSPPQRPARPRRLDELVGVAARRGGRAKRSVRLGRRAAGNAVSIALRKAALRRPALSPSKQSTGSSCHAPEEFTLL